MVISVICIVIWLYQLFFPEDLELEKSDKSKLNCIGTTQAFHRQLTSRIFHFNANTKICDMYHI